MRLVSWNILHGGGKRAPQIIDQLERWNPDIVGLTEFCGTQPSQEIASALTELGLVHQESTVSPDSPKRNSLLLASRWPLEAHEPQDIPDPRSWLHVSVESANPLSLVLFCVPNRDKNGTSYQFHDAVVDLLRPLAGTRTLAFGDTNTGVPGIDEEARFFNEREGKWFKTLADTGWTDLWRDRNPDAREFTWYNHASGAGFRLDQLFSTGMTDQIVRDVRYDWGTPPVGKLRGPSDHAAIVIDLL